MNLHNPQPDPANDPLLDALLDEALAAGEVSAELQDRVRAMADPAFGSLLDEALAPDPVDDALELSVLGEVNATLDQTTDGVLESTDAVLATIGGGRHAWLGYAAAAAVVLATGLVFYFTAGGTNPASTGPTANHTPDSSEAQPADDVFASIVPDDELDSEIDSLENRVLQVSGEPIWGGDDDFQRELWRELAPDEDAEALLF